MPKKFYPILTTQETIDKVLESSFETIHSTPFKATRQHPWRYQLMADVLDAAITKDILEAKENEEKITQRELAEKYNVSMPLIGRSIKRSSSMWRESNIRDFDELVQKELAMLNYLEEEAIQAWRRSQKDSESYSEETNEHGEYKTKKTVKGEVGDVKFLAQINRCIAQRIKLLGLEPQQSLEIKTWQDRLIEYLVDGRITYEDLANEIGESLAQTYMQKANLLKAGKE
jgi:hypothetical protein